MKARRLFFLIVFIATPLVWGCGTLHKRTYLPQELSSVAQIAGISDIRMWGDEPPAFVDEWLSMTPAEIAARYPALVRASHNYLALSGGGSDGAFGAGLLLGWTAKGDRPEFGLVTGISTGALMAPFAFLGPDYDAQLKEVYTTTSTKDIVTKVSTLSRIRSNAAAGDTKPMRKLLAKYVDQKMMEAIAVEHRRGRRLLIGTTNLDAGRAVVWNIGAIAASGDPKALDLIRDVLLASAAIPVLFPPVFFEVVANGSIYDEMHVDGGVISQVFLYPSGMDMRGFIEKFEVQGTPRVYIIRNAVLEIDWKAVEPKLSHIAGRSVNTLILNQGYGDMYRLYLEANKSGIDYNLAYIPPEFKLKAKETFDKAYMNKLFDLGYRMALSGYPWEKEPPGL
jgi:predicted acylesterase/phospholipase RssA